MKFAKILDYWRHVYGGKEYPVSIQELHLLSKDLKSNLRLDFRGPITAICGTNGVGKSTIISAIIELVSPSLNSSEGPEKLKTERYKLRLKSKQYGTRRENNIGFKSIGIRNLQKMDFDRVSTINPAAISHNLTVYFSGMKKTLNEALSSSDYKLLKKDDLEAICYIMGREYKYCKVYEIEISAEIGELPYFQVEENGISYGTESMGLGEIAAIYMYWRLQNAAKNSVLLIEEPETYLAPNAQSRLVDLFARYSDEQKIWIILTTHSPKIISNIPMEHVRIITNRGGKLESITPHKPADYFELLGKDIGVSILILVEDRAAKELATIWIHQFSPHILRQSEIVIAGSSESIADALAFPRTSAWLSIIGLFDGDEAAGFEKKFKEKKRKFNWPYAFLPGKQPIEQCFKDVAESHMDEFCIENNLVKSNVQLSLRAMAGINYHDWLYEFSRKIIPGYERSFSILYAFWQNKINESSLRIPFEEFAAKLETLSPQR